MSGLIGMVLTCLLTGNGSEMFISLVISVYPGYKSIKVSVIIMMIIVIWIIIMMNIISRPCSARRWRMTRGGSSTGSWSPSS